MMSLTDRKLNRVGLRSNQSLDAFLEVLDALQESPLVKEAVIDGHVEATFGF
jgi:hypothetical protein